MTQKPSDALGCRVAIDIGGTFTDLAVFGGNGEALAFGKALSTHEHLVRGIEHTLTEVGLSLEEAEVFLHGSTIAINTLLERDGAKTALVTTRGFRDVYEIGRINRPDAYNLFFVKHTPLVERAMRFEVSERLLADGTVLLSLNEDEVRALAEVLRDEKAEAVAIMFMHSYRNPEHEQRAAALLRKALPNIFVSASHEISKEYREFERTSTVAANAYIGPRVDGYLGELETFLSERSFHGDLHIVQSTGGLFPVAQARRECIRMLESGPAAGVIGAQAVCGLMGLEGAVAFDMGGTTAKAGVISNGRPLTSSHALIGAYDRALPIQTPMIDIFEVGTGGGSIARVVEGQAIRVGPTSAGSTPGPAAYGRGGLQATVTDANVLLGRIDPDRFLGGRMRLDVGAAERAVAGLAQGLELSTIETAEGIIQIAVTNMAGAIKAVTTERGLDAGGFALVTYGGAGPLHATQIAREIGMRRVLIPLSPGHFSAFGMLFSDMRHDYVLSVFEDAGSISFSDFDRLFKDLEQQGNVRLAALSTPPSVIERMRFADMRYAGQEHAVTVELPLVIFEQEDRAELKARFDAEHFRRYGTSAPEERAEIVGIRVTVSGVMPKPTVRNLAPAERPAVSTRSVQTCFSSALGYVETPVFVRQDLLAGHVINGPALIEEHASTTVLLPGDTLSVDHTGVLDIRVGD